MKSSFKSIAEAVVGNTRAEFPLESLDPTRKITMEELKKIVKEEFGKAKKVSDVKGKDVTDWGETELEKPLDWAKALSIKEFFKK